MGDDEDFAEIEESEDEAQEVSDVLERVPMPEELSFSDEEEQIEVSDEDFCEKMVPETEQAFLPPHLLLDALENKDQQLPVQTTPEERKQPGSSAASSSTEAKEHFDFEDLTNKQRVASLLADDAIQEIPEDTVNQLCSTDNDVENATEMTSLTPDLASNKGEVLMVEELACGKSVSPIDSETDDLSDLERYMCKAGKSYSDSDLVACDEKVEVTTFEEQVDEKDIQDRIKVAPRPQSFLIIEEEIINIHRTTKRHKKPKNNNNLSSFRDSKRSKVGDEMKIEVVRTLSDEEIISKLADNSQVTDCMSDSESYRTCADSTPSVSYQTAESASDAPQQAVSYHTVSESVSLDDVPSLMDRHDSGNSLTTFSEHESSISELSFTHSHEVGTVRKKPRDFDFLPQASMVDYTPGTSSTDAETNEPTKVFTDLVNKREAKAMTFEGGICNFFPMSCERATIKDQLRPTAEEEMVITRYSSESEASRNNSPLDSPKRGVSPFKRAVADPNACVPLTER